jgi:hypothetical protein
MPTFNAPTPNPNAQLEVAVCNAIAARLSLQIDWLELSLGLSQSFEETTDAGTKRIPRIYSTNSQYIDCSPDEQFQSMSFFARNGAVQINNGEDEPEMRFPLSLFVWADLSKIETGNTYDYTDQLLGDVLNVLKSYYDSEITVFQYECDPLRVYDRYTLTDLRTRLMTYPYTAFRIDFDYIHFGSLRCTNTIAVPTCQGVTIVDQDGNTVATVPPGGTYSVIVGDRISPLLPLSANTNIVIPAI